MVGSSAPSSYTYYTFIASVEDGPVRPRHDTHTWGKG